MIRFALPSGSLRLGAAAFLQTQGLGSHEYSDGSRAYRPAADLPELIAFRVFRDRDIPIQIALGSYQAGICSSIAVDELLARFPNEGIVKLAHLPFGLSYFCVLGSPGRGVSRSLRIVSEFPNLSERYALARRLPRYSLVAVNGAAWNYPPEDADLALVLLDDLNQRFDHGIAIEEVVATSSACLVANKRALAEMDLSALLAPYAGAAPPLSRVPASAEDRNASAPAPTGNLRLAVPDGHQQREAPDICRRAGLRLEGYDETHAVNRPQAVDEALSVKVVRPQDMPQMVALGAFDLALSGRDCLLNHLAQFPSSPVEEVVDLGRQRYRWAAVVDGALDAPDLVTATARWRAGGQEVIRIASEYPNLADHFARERHIGRYSVIPVVGASEGFVPEDAEILIEGSETGRTWEANNLVPLEWLFESTMIVIAGKHSTPAAGQVELIERLREAAA